MRSALRLHHFQREVNCRRAGIMARTSGDMKVLNFGGVTLRRSDVRRLEEPEELNDQILEFFFEYLTGKVCERLMTLELSSRMPVPLLLVGPIQTFWLLHCPLDSLSDSVKPMLLPEREMVIFALNDNPDPSAAEGGCHWSLIVYSRPENVFEHYDSLGGLNGKVAEQFVEKIKSCMGKGSSQAKLIDRKTPQQQNFYDCGVFVMKICHILSIAYLKEQRAVKFEDIEDTLQTELTPTSVKLMRAMTVATILKLAKHSSSLE